MHDDRIELLGEVAGYYSKKIEEHGNTARGVDWNGEDSQLLRFQQLCRIVEEGPNSFSLNDLGCGYGALHEHLASKGRPFDYLGVDVSERMIASALVRHSNSSGARFIVAAAPDVVADYGVASGIFNVRQARGDEEWQNYLKETLDVIDQTSRRGFAFNCLTSYSDADKRRDYLYYADPCFLFDFCKRRYSRQVSLLHDYGLYEFTILVRKE
jgi:SAM-dependent methyltransferase